MEEAQSESDLELLDPEYTEEGNTLQDFSDDQLDFDLSNIIITSVVSEGQIVPEGTDCEFGQQLSEEEAKLSGGDEDEGELGPSFVENRQSPAGLDDEGSEDEGGDSGEYSDSSEESDSDGSSDDDEDRRSDSDQIATFPYMDSDSESEESVNTEQLLSTSTAHAVPEQEIETIFIDDDDEDDLVNIIKSSGMTCIRCPVGKAKFTDQHLFSLHYRRHFGQCHFVCPTCLKPFTRFSFCLGHEVRVHGTKFNYEHPRISEANEYVKAKKEKDSLRELNSEGPNLDGDGGSTDGLDEISEEEDTDDEDPKFYPDYTVPSTTLYPYRGPKLEERCESYEIQLKYGRKKPTVTNTIAHVVLAHRQQLKDAGRIPDTVNRFWKEPVVVVPKQDFGGGEHYKKREDRSDLYPRTTTSTNNRKRRRSSSESDPDEKQTKRRPPRKRKTVSLQKSRILDRTFVSSLICRVCQLCNYVWKSEADLSVHRDEKHPTKKLLDLMTVPTATTVAEDKLFCTILRPLKRKRNQTGNSSHEKRSGASRSEITKEAFLLTLGLISVKKLTLRKRKPRLPKVKPCFVKMERLAFKGIPRSGRVFLCDSCSYLNKSRDLINLHKIKSHGLENSTANAKRRLNMPKRKAGQLQIDSMDIISLVSSTSSHDYDDLEDKNWRISRSESIASWPLGPSDPVAGPSCSSSSVSASSFLFR